MCNGVAAASVQGKPGALLRRLVFDVDDLCGQIRWHVGQALLLLETYPELLAAGKGDDPLLRNVGIPADVALRLRAFIGRPRDVVFGDLSQNWRGGTAAGWVFHMMIDNAVYRALSALDRLAAIAWYAAELPQGNVYFRSRKMTRVHEKLATASSKALLEIAERPILQLITAYRDGYSHTTKAYSRVAGFPPSDSWETDTGEMAFVDPDGWDAELLFALGRAAFCQFTDALPHVSSICAEKWLPPDAQAPE